MRINHDGVSFRYGLQCDMRRIKHILMNQLKVIKVKLCTKDKRVTSIELESDTLSLFSSFTGKPEPSSVS